MPTPVNRGNEINHSAPRTDVTPRIETIKTESHRPKAVETPKNLTPMPQQSVNRMLSWVAGIALVLAVVAIFVALNARTVSNDAMTVSATKADKSDIPNYGMKSSSLPTNSNTLGNTTDAGTNNGQVNTLGANGPAANAGSANSNNNSGTNNGMTTTGNTSATGGQ